MVRRTDIDIVSHSIDGRDRAGSEFITSAIDMADLRSPISPSFNSTAWGANDKSKDDLRPSLDPSLDSSDLRAEVKSNTSKEEITPYHGV
jgi:hypothetical protein